MRSLVGSLAAVAALLLPASAAASVEARVARTETRVSARVVKCDPVDLRVKIRIPAVQGTRRRVSAVVLFEQRPGKWVEVPGSFVSMPGRDVGVNWRFARMDPMPPLRARVRARWFRRGRLVGTTTVTSGQCG